MRLMLRLWLPLSALLLSYVAVSAEEFTESDYRRAGPPECGANRFCAVGEMLEDEVGRIKIFVATDARLNGRELSLDVVTPDIERVAGKVVVISFSGVSGKRLDEAQLVSLAPAPATNKDESSPDADDDEEVAAAPKPISNIDLSHWKVTLPVNSDGSDEALEVTELTGFTMPPYFDARTNSITFSASVNGAKTSGSNYPRSELREMNGTGDEFEWTVQQGGTLSATLAVVQVPTRTAISGGAAPAPVPLKVPGPGRVVIGQIHGPDDELCRLYYDNGILYFNNDKSGPSRDQKSFALKDSAGNLTNIPMGKSFSYTIDVNATRLLVTAKVNGKTYTATDSIGSFWRGKPLYFKAGAYVQVGAPGSEARETGRGTGTVTFTAIRVSH